MSDVEENGQVLQLGTADVSAVNIKPPVFSETSAAMWFKVMEAQFHLKNITTSRTKFYHVLSSIPTNILDNISLSAVEKEDYDSFKREVVSFYEKTKPELFERLISSAVMTGRPSAYLRELQQLAEKVNVGEDLIRHKFLQSLPSTISPALGSQKSLSLTEMGRMADELMPLHSKMNIVDLVDTHVSTNTGDNYFNQNDHMHTNHFSSNVPRGKYGESQIPFAVRPFHPDQRPKMCRAHIYYGARAKTCKNFCAYPDKSKCRMTPNSRPSSPARPTRQGNYRGESQWQ